MEAILKQIVTKLDSLEQGQGRMEKDISSLKEGQARLEKDVAELKTDVAVLKTDVAVLKTDVAELKTDVAVLKTDVAVLKTDVAVLKTDVLSLKEGQAMLEQKFDKMAVKIENELVDKTRALFDGREVHNDRFELLMNKLDGVAKDTSFLVREVSVLKKAINN